MSTISPDSLREIALTVDLGRHLTLIVVFGPGYLAADGLAEIREELDSKGPVLEHPLDRLGPNIAETIAHFGKNRPIVLVSGLERMVDDRREHLLASLNLLRDTLNKQPAAVIMWVPSEAADEFRRVCVDLFHWRALTVYADAPENEKRRIRHAYLVSLASATTDRGLPMTAVPELEVLVAGASAPQGIDSWLNGVHRGVLLGSTGSGKTTAIRRYCALRAQYILDADTDSELPVFVAARLLDQAIRAQWRWQALTHAVLPELDEETADWIAAKLGSGPAVLLVDGIDELPPERRGIIDEQFLALVAGNPRLRIVLATRPVDDELAGDWQQAVVQRLQPAAAAAMLRSLGCDSAAIVDLLEWANAKVLLTVPLLLHTLADYASRRGDARELDLTEVIEMFVVSQLGLRDATRQVSHRHIKSIAETYRQLIALASPSTRASTSDLTTLDFVTDRTGLIRRVKTDSGYSHAFTHDMLRDYFVAHSFSPDELVARASDPTWRVATMHALRLLEPRQREQKAIEIWEAAANEPPPARWAMRMLVLRAMLADRDLELRTRFIERAELALQQAQRDGEPASAWTPVAKLIERVDEP